MAEKFEIRTLEQLNTVYQRLRQIQPDLHKPVMIELKEASVRRSLSANALYWVWLDRLAEHFSQPKKPLTKDGMHDVCRHLHLGYKTSHYGKKTAVTGLKSTTELDSAEMCHYMTLIDQWAANHGCLLPRPEDSEYEQYIQIMRTGAA